MAATRQGEVRQKQPVVLAQVTFRTIAMQSIQALMKTLERSPQWQANASLRRVLARWPQLVGEAVAQHSRPTKIQRRVLLVSVSSAAWSQTLTFERSRILQKLHESLPETQSAIHDLRFAAGDWHQAGRRSQPSDSPSISQHPSWVAWPQQLDVRPSQSATSAFQQWAERRQAQLASQSQCPRCQSPCPTQEITRWGVCAVCIAHQWHKPQSQNRQSSTHKAKP